MRSLIKHFNRDIKATLMAIFFIMIGSYGLSQMSGDSYTIDPAGGDFPNFKSIQEAIDSLTSPTMGVGGPVTINIASGNYQGQYVLGVIPGVNANDTVVFQSASGDSSDVKLRHDFVNDGSKNYIIHIDGADYVSFKGITFNASTGSYDYMGRAIWFGNSPSNYIKFLNCSFIGKTYTTSYDDNTLISSDNDFNDYIVFKNCLFTSGEKGIMMFGNSAANLNQGMVIQNCIFNNQKEHVIYLRYFEAPVIDGNEMTVNSDAGQGIYFRDVTLDHQITNNKIYLNNPSEVIYLYYCDGTSGQEGLIANNFISVKVADSSPDNCRGIRITNSTYQKVYFNSVTVFNSWRESTRSFYQSGSGSNIDVRNNIFFSASGGYTFYLESSGSTTSDYNNYYTIGNYIAYRGGSNIRDLAELQDGYPTNDQHSISVNPVFTSNTDMHTTTFRLDGFGDPNTDITDLVGNDIDGEARTAGSPDIGADEFSDPTGAALFGTLTIGPDTTYETIASAWDDLKKYGISSSVTFNILDDGSPYEEHLYFLPVTGADASNTVTFQPDPSNDQDVIITYNATSSMQEVIGFMRLSYVNIKNLTISATNSSYPEVIRFYAYCHHDSIVGCTLSSIGTTDGHAAIMSKDDYLSDIYIIGNEIIDARTSIHIEGVSTRRFENIVITDNIIEGPFSYGVYLYYCDAPVVNRNTITTGTTTYSYNAIYLNQCRYNYQVVGNKITNLAYETGIYIGSSDGSLGKEGLVANNFIRMTGSAGKDATGIYTNGSDNVDIVFNTVRIDYTNTNPGSDAYYNNSGSKINVWNNIFCQYGRGRAIYNNTTSAFDSCNYNCYYSPGIYLARWGTGEKTTLEEWQTSSGRDANSVFADPAFKLVSDDLHVNSSFLDGAGIAFDTITVDIDEELRESPPDIGADEFADPVTPLGGSYTIGGESPHYVTIADARKDLRLRGISAPVTFNIRTGKYPEPLGSYFPISGANSNDTVVIQSESGNPDSVTIYSSDAISLAWMRGVRYFTIRNLTFSSTGTGGGNPISLRGYTKKVNIINNELITASTWPVLNIDSAITVSILIKNNSISNGGYGINFKGDQNTRSTNTWVISNDISGFSTSGIYLNYHQAPVVINNTVTSTANSDINCIKLENCPADLVLTGNTLIAKRGYGISMSNCDAVDPFYGLITNNMISIDGTYTAGGIYINSSDRKSLYHNSINITSTNTDNPYAIYLESNNNEIEMVNNVLSNTGGGRVLYIEDVNDVTTSDFNNIYGVGTSRYVRVGSTEHPDLASYRGATGLETNSMSLDPLFYSATELYSAQPEFYEAGTPLADVPYDIDSVSRTETANPDLGAAEFTCGTPEWNIVVSPSCLGDSTIYIDHSTNIAPGSTFSWDCDGDSEPDHISNKSNDTVMFYFDAAGEYTTYLQVTQIAGCNDYTTVNVTVSDLPSLNIITKGAYCGRDDGEASVEVTGGIAPYNYFWSTGETDTAITGLALGTYTLAVSDANGCTQDSTFTIEDAMQVEVTPLTTSTCGIPDGSAVVTATGGYEPYSYVWSNGETSDTNKTLSTGRHYVNVIDDSLCYAQGYVNIESDGSGPQVNLENITHNLCYGDKNGVIDISISGGVSPYSILWSNGATTDSIYGLASGIYDVLVTAADECLGAGSFEVTQPSRIAITTVVEDASCAGSDGKAVAVVSGGTKPYAYMWSSGGIYQIEEGLAAGVYSITVTDGRGCQEVKPVIVNNIGGPVVTIDTIIGASCSDPTDGAIDISVSGGTFPFTYLWSPGAQITPDISGLTPGSYVVKVTDQEGCVGVNTAEVKQAAPEVNPICVVTVDTLTRKNMVVWEKQNITDVDYYVIYRETNLKGIYQPIGIRPVDSLSVYIDSVADPAIRSWRYKLSVVDVCGVESELSDYHKTMHLTINVGLDGKINLIWDHYEGFDVNTYDVWRYSASGGWEKIQSMPANLTSYTDDNPPLEDLTYYIEVLRPTPCTTSKAGTLNSSKSNRQSRLKGTGYPDLFLNKYNLSIYPNPGSGLFNLSIDNLSSENVTLKVYDITGKLVYINEFNHLNNRFETVIDLSGYADGIYHVQLKTNNALFHRVLIKE